MRYAIISDIHSNYTALSTVFDNLNRYMVDKVICLGDIVGYGAEPNKCLAAVRKNCDYTILGNHDNAVIKPEGAKNFNQEARRSIEWTQEQTKKKHLSFLKELPLRLKGRSFMGFHATPHRPGRWGYVNQNTISAEIWNSFDTPLCFIGHSHVPMVMTYPKTLLDENPIEIDFEEKYIINVGSVGQPRDGDRRLAFGIYDEKERIYELIRLDYDYEKAVKKIRKAGLPTYNSNRLLMGK